MLRFELAHQIALGLDIILRHASYKLLSGQSPTTLDGSHELDEEISCALLPH